MKTATKRVVYALAALAVAAGVAVLFLPAPIEVDVAAVSTGSLVVTIDEDGETRAHDRFVVSAPVAGRVSLISCPYPSSTPRQASQRPDWRNRL